MSDFSWMQVVDAGARALSTGSDAMTNAAIVERLRDIYGSIKANAGEESGWLKHYEAISIAADRIVILADAVRGDLEYIRRLADERNAAREERDELRGIASKLTAERDEMQGELRKAETESSMLRVECGVIAAERNEARQALNRCKQQAALDELTRLDEELELDKRMYEGQG